MRLKSTAGTASYWILLVLFFVTSGACSEPVPEPQRTVAPGTSVRDLVKALDTSIHFYGRVLDQDGRPVAGAVISGGIRHFSAISPYFMGSKKLDVKTDQGGFFEISGYRGSDLFIGGISKDGYEYILSQNTVTSFDYGGSVELPFIPDENNPVTFWLRRKLNGRTYLIKEKHWDFEVKVEDSGKARGYDFIENKRTRSPEDRPSTKWSEVCDLRYLATFEEETEDWRVVLHPCGQSGGIVVSDQVLYEAPEDGYQQEWIFVAKDLTLFPLHYIYLKSRSPSIFTRIELTYINVNEKHVRLYGNFSTNPYGDRVLDAVDIPLEPKQRYQLEQQLKSEAQTALAEGRLPPRPKIMALIEAAKRGEE